MYQKQNSSVKLVKKPDIVTVIEREGITLTPKSNKLWALCPFHNETRPSFNVSVEKQVFYCFGCQAGGDVVKFIMTLKNFTYLQALRYLHAGRNVTVTAKRAVSFDEKLIERFRQWEKDYYNECIKHLHAMMGLQKRITTPEELEQYAWIFDEMQKTDYHLDVLLYGDDQDKFNLFKEIKKYEV